MSGTQTKFNTNESIKGLTIIANIDLKTKSATPSITENIKVKVLNDGEEVAETEERIRYIAPSEMVTINGMTNYNQKEETTEVKKGEKITGELDRKSEAKTATETITIMNNYSYTCGNIKILGRTPSEGNKDMETGEVLGSTFTAKMVSKIRAVSGIEEEKIKVYYSTNSEATEDIEAEGNEWTTEVTNLEEVKSYLIIVEGEMKTGDIMKFEYDVEIPEGLEKQKSTYSMFKVFYTNIDGITRGQEGASISPVIGASTGHEDDISVTLEANVENGEAVEAGSTVKYIAHIKNNLATSVKNATLSVDIPSGAVFMKYEYDEFKEEYEYVEDSSIKTYTKEIQTLEPGETIDEEFYIKVNNVISKPNGGSISEEFFKQFISRDDFETEEEYQKFLDNIKNNPEIEDAIIEKLYIEPNIKREDYNSDEEYEAAKKKALEELKKQLEEEEKDEEVKIVAKIIYDKQKYESNVITNPKKDGELSIKIFSDYEDKNLKKGAEIQFTIELKKLRSDSYKNVEVTCDIPKGLTFEESTYNIEVSDEKLKQVYDEETIKQMKENGIIDSMQNINKTVMEQNGQKLKWIIAELSESKTITFTCTLDELKESEEERILNVFATEKDSESKEEKKSNNIIFSVGKPKLQITHECSNNTSEITEKDEIQYIYTVENIGKYTSYDTVVSDFLSSGFSEATIIYYGSNNKYGNTFNQGEDENSVKIDISAGEKITFTLKAKANFLSENTNGMISHYFTVKNDYQELKSSVITHTVKRKQYSDDDYEKKKYSISGIAWIDENSDGEKSNDEKTLSDISVVLLNKKGNVVSVENTGKNGEYEFRDITEGSYVVAFLYDVKQYDITKYNKDGSNTNKVIQMTLNINDTDTVCGATDTIDLNENLYNINIGLIKNEKFDLNLIKTISKATIKTNGKTISKEYNNSKLEKIEIKSQELKGATVAIEYNIIVTNEGVITGKATKIVDYLKDTDLKFNSELNSGWYLGTDGNLYNSSLNNKDLKPGESASVKLILTKTMTENNTGITNNTAEIYEAYNKDGKEDYDSTPANKTQNEDDFGTAEIIIGVKTGQVTYLILIILITSGVIFAIILIKRKVKKI